MYINIMFSSFPSYQPIPHSLDTLSEFINRMEQTLSQNGDDTELISVAFHIEKAYF